MSEYTERNKLRANLRYYKIMNKEFKKQNSFLRYDIYCYQSKIKRLERKLQEKDYLIMELLKKTEVNK